MIDWPTIGAGLGGLFVGAMSYFAGRGKRQVSEAKNEAETDVVTLLRQEVERLSKRVEGLETREGRMIRHIYRLEAMLRELGKEPPHFDLDTDVP